MQQELDHRDHHAAGLEQMVQGLQATLAEAQQEQQQVQVQLQHARSAAEQGASEREYLQAETSQLQQALQAKINAAHGQQDVLDTTTAQLHSKVGEGKLHLGCAKCVCGRCPIGSLGDVNNSAFEVHS